MSGVRTSGGRVRATGTLSVLFVGGLGLAVLAGPASCPCDRNVVASADVPGPPPSLSRFTYAIASAAVEHGLPRASMELTAAPVAEEGLPTLSNVAMIEPEEPAGSSPITTSAIDALAARAANPPSHIGLLPPTPEALSDNAPRQIELAAAAPGEGADELAPVLPPVVIDTPLTEIEVVEPEESPAASEPAVQKKRPRKHASPSTPRKHATHKQTPNASPRQKAPIASSTPNRRDKLAKVPKWVRQMFDNPWQTKAFSYIQ
jgi:hypothetical protein